MTRLEPQIAIRSEEEGGDNADTAFEKY